MAVKLVSNHGAFSITDTRHEGLSNLVVLDAVLHLFGFGTAVTGPIGDAAPFLCSSGSGRHLAPSIIVSGILAQNGTEAVARSTRHRTLTRVLHILLFAALSDIFTSNSANDGIINTDPFTSFLTTHVNSVVSTAGVLSVVVYDTNQFILGHSLFANLLGGCDVFATSWVEITLNTLRATGEAGRAQCVNQSTGLEERNLIGKTNLERVNSFRNGVGVSFGEAWRRTVRGSNDTIGAMAIDGSVDRSSTISHIRLCGSRRSGLREEFRPA
ncbi:hypothetical protein HG530_007515 [Fusarium avenaceum]|nr:hypothetical protein HG530_007515 [Fusarium avenaceum]